MEKVIEYLDYDEKDLIEKPLWYHKRGLTQTATGYGSKLVTSKMIKLGKKLYRVYCMIYGNSGSCYIIQKGQKIFLR